MNIFDGDEDLQRRYVDALKTSVEKTFGESSPKKEGEYVSFDLADMNVTFPVRPEFQNPETTYVERRVPIELEDEAHELIDNWLKSKGYGEDL